jgi:hypothetical protein
LKKPNPKKKVCPACNGSGKVKAEDKEEEEEKAADEDKEEKTVDEEDKKASVVTTKEDVFAKGKHLKKADLSRHFKKDYTSEKNKEFANRVKQSFINANKELEPLINQLIK